jgi:hypothetical protein
MGKITFRTKESSGQASYETETIYESSEDFFFVEEQKRESLSQAVKSFVGGMGFDNPLDESTITEVEVKKKAKETKH